MSGSGRRGSAGTLELEDTRGMTARYVLELKDSKLGLKQTFEELERAMVNREASAGIAVFSREEHAPIGTPWRATIRESFRTRTDRSQRPG